jgi:hypothetical protein
VEAFATAAQCRQLKQRRMKRGRLFYSTPKELFRSRMRRSKVVPSFNAGNGNTLRTLDFQRINIDYIGCRSTWILSNLEEEAEAMANDDADVNKDRLD